MQRGTPQDLAEQDSKEPLLVRKRNTSRENPDHVSKRRLRSPKNTAPLLSSPRTLSSSPSLVSKMFQITFAMFSLLALFQTLSVLGESLQPRQAAQEPIDAYSITYADNLGANIPDRLRKTLVNFEHGKYPTDFTRGIVPKQLHSHNDYWRNAPLYSALSVGAISVEADIWLINNTLYVGHEKGALSQDRTFENLYVNPLMDVLNKQNPHNDFSKGKVHNGVFDTNSAQTLYLWLDCKTDGEKTFQKAIEALAPLHDARYLTTYTKSIGVIYRAVTVIGTGNTPLSSVQGVSPRYWFWDAPLTQLGPGKAYENITSDVTVIASTDFGFAGFASVGRHPGAVFNDAQLARLATQIGAAKKKGIGARYWDTPGWPVRTRNAVWRAVWENGAALVNVDDLYDAAFTDW